MANTNSRVTRLTGSSTGVVPDGVTGAELTLVGGGGGGGAGANNTAPGGNGGGSAEWALKIPLSLAAGETYTYAVGAKGVGGVAADGSAGGDTTFTCAFGSFTVHGGFGGGTATQVGATGGGRLGAAGVNQSPGVSGTYEPVFFTGGSSGGGLVNAQAGKAGGMAPGNLGGAGGATGPAGNAGGGGGGSTPWGPGGRGGNGQVTASRENGQPPAATAYGAAGGGGSGSFNSGRSQGGDGMDGTIELAWTYGP